MLCYFAEVAFPFASRELPFIAKAISVKSCRAVITANKFSRIEAYTADIYTSIGQHFFLRYGCKLAIWLKDRPSSFSIFNIIFIILTSGVNQVILKH
jgi:hypothetical protein